MPIFKRGDLSPLMDIKLLDGSVEVPPTSEVNAEYTSLVPANRLALATRTVARNYTAYPDDDFVWSASAGSDGTFDFYAMPQKNSGSIGASGQFQSAQVSVSGWHKQNAIFQYALHASMPQSFYGHAINLYA
jgi:hypothetical protein